MDGTRYLSRVEAARYLGIGARTLDRWKADGRVAFHKAGGRVFYSVDDLDEAMAATRQEARRGQERESRLPRWLRRASE